jgi:hypothetical protein
MFQFSFDQHGRLDHETDDMVTVCYLKWSCAGMVNVSAARTSGVDEVDWRPAEKLYKHPSVHFASAVRRT